MIRIPTIPETEILSIHFPRHLALYVTQEQFAALAAVNRDLRLERTAKGELIVNPPTGWQTGEYNSKISGELYMVAQR
jgi:Uma2 family endonuclease